MSEEVKEAPAKKKGKLPLIAVLIVVLAGGGFFGMKAKSGGPKKVEIKASAEAPESLGEFLLNLNSTTNVYLRTEISLGFREGFKKESLEAKKDAIKDAITTILRSKTPQQVGSSQTGALKKELAAAVNKILLAAASAEDKKAQDELDKAAADGKDASNFDSPAGPVLNVYFTSFATQ